jgi:hypothetical protein
MLSKGHFDTNARLTHIKTLGGKVLLDHTGGPPATGDDPMLTVATLDFIAVGGSGAVRRRAATTIHEPCTS